MGLLDVFVESALQFNSPICSALLPSPASGDHPKGTLHYISGMQISTSESVSRTIQSKTAGVAVSFWILERIRLEQPCFEPK